MSHFVPALTQICLVGDEEEFRGEAEEVLVDGDRALDTQEISAVRAVLRNRDFRTMWLSSLGSTIGTWMQKTAVSWMVYSITGSVFLLGLATFLSMIPSLFLAPLAGSIIGHYDKHKTLLFLQSLAMLQAGTLALLIYLKI